MGRKTDNGKMCDMMQGLMCCNLFLECLKFNVEMDKDSFI